MKKKSIKKNIGSVLKKADVSGKTKMREAIAWYIANYYMCAAGAEKCCATKQ